MHFHRTSMYFRVQKLNTSTAFLQYLHVVSQYLHALLQYFHVRKPCTFMYLHSTFTYFHVLPQYFYAFLRTTTVLPPFTVLLGISIVLPCTLMFKSSILPQYHYVFLRTSTCFCNTSKYVLLCTKALYFHSTYT